MDFYAIQRPVGKISDAPEIRDAFIKVFDIKTKVELAEFGLLLAKHLFDVSGYVTNNEIETALLGVTEWIAGKCNYHKPRTLAGCINDLAKQEADACKAKFYRAMAQIACIPHVKFHALWACDYAIAFFNRLYPGNFDAVREERRMHIKLINM